MAHALESTFPGPSRRRRARVTWVLTGVVAVAVGTALRHGVELAALLPSCAFRDLFHLACPTCGFTRALVALAHGRLGNALAWHPLAPLVVIELAIGWLVWGRVVMSGARPPAPRALAWLALANGIAFLATWVARLALGALPS